MPRTHRPTRPNSVRSLLTPELRWATNKLGENGRAGRSNVNRFLLEKGKRMAEKTKLLVGAIALVLLLTSCDQPAASPASTETEPDVVLEPTVTTVPTPPKPMATTAPTGTIEPTPKPTATTEPPATEAPDGSEFWVEMQDPQYGVGFAVPCYWEVNFPRHPAPGGSGFLRNYTEEFVFSFPRGVGVFENGGIKIGMNFLHGPSWPADPGTSLIGFVKLAVQTRARDEHRGN